MRPRDLPGSRPAPERLSEPVLRGGGWSLLLLLSSYNLSSLLCSLVTTPLSFPASNLAMSSFFWALAATAALLLISILLICASSSKFQIIFLGYTIHRQMFSGMSTPGGSSGACPPGGPPGGPLSGGALLGVRQVVLLRAVLRVVLCLGVQAVRHPGFLRCRIGQRLGRVPCYHRCQCLPIDVPNSAGVGQGCFPYCGRELEGPLQPNFQDYHRLLCQRLWALQTRSPWAPGDAGGLVHLHCCR